MTSIPTRAKKTQGVQPIHEARTPTNVRRSRRNTEPDVGRGAAPLLHGENSAEPYDFPQDAFGTPTRHTPTPLSREQQQHISRHLNGLSLLSPSDPIEGDPHGTSSHTPANITLQAQPSRRRRNSDPNITSMSADKSADKARRTSSRVSSKKADHTTAGTTAAADNSAVVTNATNSTGSTSNPHTQAPPPPAEGSAPMHQDPPLNPADEAAGQNHEDINFIPLLDSEAVDQLTLSLGLTNFWLTIAPSNMTDYEEDPTSFNITCPPMKSSFLQHVITKLLDNHSVNLNNEGRGVKIISAPNTKPPWRAVLRLHNDDDNNDIQQDFNKNGLQVPTPTHEILNFTVDMNIVKGSNLMSNCIGYKVQWGHNMQVTQAMIDDMIVDFDARIPKGFPRVLTTAHDGTTTYTGHWEVIRASTIGYDAQAAMRVQASDSAMIFKVSKESLIAHTDGINRHLAAPPYVYMPAIVHNKGALVKLDVDIMGHGYCKGSRTTHIPDKKDSPDDAYSDKDTCIYCVRDWSTMKNKLVQISRCRNHFCALNMGFKADNPQLYEELKIAHDCVKEQRQKEGLMLNYSLPKIPEIQTKQWTQVTPAQLLEKQVCTELKGDLACKAALAEQAKQIRDAAAKAQADRGVTVPHPRANRFGTQPAKKRKIFGGHTKWPA